ncbi:ribosomal protein L5, putative [Eimeria acervulina]|uniref:Ribosomal protein L5, putative n=1 Tax=Eimeria acervulina TaxID=5801 RepID=U6GU69_EIMAC|nr:ribosomal protein L5, putative [Eimeria acervulina]CDI83811.1 ribosomal protein L5, putative [Eimeria acervulina]
MAFVKAIKNKAYFKRFQVKYRRRREGKTDYAARRRLTLQDKNKYNAPKYRFVVRVTNTRVLCQVMYATMQGDRLVCSADSKELTRYGIKVGLTNYSAAYATGLLLARRLLKQKGLADEFVGVEKPTGEEYHVEEVSEERRPFKCVLDVGIVSTTVGNRVFGAMKGACDGGLHIPHSNKRFPGFTKGEEGAEDSYNPEVHRSRIYGLHVAEYMRTLKEEDPERYQSQFSAYIRNKVDADSIEKMYQEAFQKIRANPDPVKKEAREVKRVRQGAMIKTAKSQYVRNTKIDKETRKERVLKKIQMVAEKMAEDE